MIWSSSQKCRRIFFWKLLSYLACGQIWVFRTCHIFFCLVCGPLQHLNYWIYGRKVWCYWEHPCATHLKPGEYHWEPVGEHGGNNILRRIMPPYPSQKEIRWAFFLSACVVGSIDCMQIKHLAISSAPWKYTLSHFNGCMQILVVTIFDLN